MQSDLTCSVCSSPNASVFFEMPAVPVLIGVQWPTELEARDCRRGDLVMTFCPDCGFVWNSAFDLARLEYDGRYDNALHYSPVFQKYAQGLARRLIQTHGLRGKDIVEIGCGQGDFLKLLCEAGENRGVGFDPSCHDNGNRGPADDRLTLIQDHYTEKYSHYKADLVCCRHVFEHIPRPHDFLSMVRRVVGDRHDSVLYFEVPNVMLILRDLSVWDIIYEHCSYFSAASLCRVFELCGFDVLRVDETYDGQFLGIEALPRNGTVRNGTPKAVKENLLILRNAIEAFTQNLRQKTETWKVHLRRIEERGLRAVAWGAGAKAVGFLNLMKIDQQVPYVVDINPNKHGHHIAGTGQMIVPPAFLQDYQPDVVILMNPIYHGEIEAELKELGVAAEFLNA